MTRAAGAVLIGIGNPFRQDDGIGPALAAIIGELNLPEVEVHTSDGEPSRLLDAWSGARLAVVVDAACSDGGVAGQIHRFASDGLPGGWVPAGPASTHGLGIGDAIYLAEVMGQLPDRLVVFAVEAADIGYGEHLSQAVSASLPDLTQAVLAELKRTDI